MGLERPTYWHRLFGTRAALAPRSERREGEPPPCPPHDYEDDGICIKCGGAVEANYRERKEGEPAWTMQWCPECHGTGKEGTGTPSGEGGEDFRECFRCQGTGFVPFPACATREDG